LPVSSSSAAAPPSLVKSPVRVSRLRLRTDSGGRFVAGSICAFNGLDDGSETGNPVTPGVVQSFGFLLAGLVHEAGGAGSFAHVIHDEGPGTNCHGFASGGGEE